MKEYWTSLASLLGALAFVQSLLHAVFPAELRLAFAKLLRRLSATFSPYGYFEIPEIDGVNTNELYNAVHLYLSRAAASGGCGGGAGSARLSLCRGMNSSALTFGLSSSDRVEDAFRGAGVAWEHVSTPRAAAGFSWRPFPEERRAFTLRIRRRDAPLLVPSYLDHIMESAADIRRRSQERLLYTNARGGAGAVVVGAVDAAHRGGHPWEPVPFKHPSTFDTLALDPRRKAEIMADLRDFAEGRDFYSKTGRAWKRGYLLYGPPGTGKSSMIAAMANFLRYDVYDLELAEVHTNSELRKLLMKTTSKSIIVIEDIDCSVNLASRGAPGKAKRPPGGADAAAAAADMIGDGDARTVTLSGLLNFTDGLWSCCGSERIFVFTTNHVEKLDPALLRSGRMDMHVFMSYCTFPALRILMKNYLGIDDAEDEEEGEGGKERDGLWRELEEAVGEAEITPADVSEVLIKNRRRQKREAMAELLRVLRSRAEEKRNKAARSDECGAAAELRKKRMMEGAEEDEEQEKRALESPKEGGGGGAMDDEANEKEKGGE